MAIPAPLGTSKRKGGVASVTTKEAALQYLYSQLKASKIALSKAEVRKGVTDEEIANLCITLINQATYMLKNLIARQQEQFITEGGIREQMTKARLEYRNKNK